MENKKNTKIVHKRSTLLQKLAYILRPFVIYMVIKTFAMLTFALAVYSFPVQGSESDSYILNSVVNAVSSIIAVCFLLNDFLKEVYVTGEIDIDANMFGQFFDFCKKGMFRGNAKPLILCAVFGMASAFAINIGLELLSVQLRTGENFGSEKYETVRAIQYSVPLWLGIILYGVISPLVEEIVFRGVIFNRIKRFYSLERAMFFSALLFGIFHGNLPQFIYGMVMGVFMAFTYEYAGCFGAPVLFHMAANISVFLASWFFGDSNMLITPVFCAVFAILSAALLIFMKKRVNTAEDINSGK